MIEPTPDIDAPDPEPTPVDPAPVDPTPDDIMAQCVAIESERRKWIASIVPLIEHYGHEPMRDEHVQAALDTMVMAACERLKRILRSDLD